MPMYFLSLDELLQASNVDIALGKLCMEAPARDNSSKKIS